MSEPKQYLTLADLVRERDAVAKTWSDWDETMDRIQSVLFEFRSAHVHAGVEFDIAGLQARYEEMICFNLRRRPFQVGHQQTGEPNAMVEHGPGLIFSMTLSGMVRIEYSDWCVAPAGAPNPQPKIEVWTVVAQSDLNRAKLLELLRDFVDKAARSHWAFDKNGWAAWQNWGPD